MVGREVVVRASLAAVGAVGGCGVDYEFEQRKRGLGVGGDLL